ncbi:MAG: hypothetical protein E4G98_05520 [Promethearchaeota archaeon]|nr:MAG: hypothetical protein E4G98_05520 [Candidatus Lokiarchaeota archaeon]
MSSISQKMNTMNTDPTSKGRSILHLSLYTWIYILQGVFATHVGQFVNIYLKTPLGYSIALLALIHFLIYIPLIIKPALYLFLQRTSAEVKVRRNIVPSGIFFLLCAVVTGFLTPDNSPVWIILAFVIMQLSLVPLDLTVDSYIIPQYPKRSVLLSILQIGASIVGGQIAYALVIGFTNYFTTQTWMVYYIMLGVLVIPALVLGMMTRPKIYPLLSRKIIPFRQLLPEDQPVMKWLIIFIVGINSSYLAGSVMDLWLFDRFGDVFYVELGRNTSLLGAIGIGLVVILALLPKIFRKIRFPLLYIIGIITVINFVVMIYAPLQVLVITQSIAIGFTYVFTLIYLSLMLEVIPESIRPAYYQVCAVIFALARSIYEPLGLVLAIWLGNANVILLTAGLMFLNIPILVIFGRMLAKHQGQ